MLAKQYWRLLSEPDSLFSQVLRSKYYLYVDLTNVVSKKGSSFTWQSIIAGVKTFKSGCIWRPGCGATHWIPTSATRKVSSPRGSYVLKRVEELTNPVIGFQDEELLRENM
jgi:hypothetical protein